MLKITLENWSKHPIAWKTWTDVMCAKINTFDDRGNTKAIK